MIWSRYNTLVKDSEGHYLLFNTMSQCLLQINKEDIAAFKYLRSNPDAYTDFDNADYLLDSKIIVENDDLLLAVHIDTVLKNRYNPFDISLTIAVTRDCNFACVYCYEMDRQPIYLNEAVEDDIIAFLKRVQGLRSVFITWYGGEPLLNFKCIKSLTAKIKKLGVRYTSMMVTNGYLLSNQICQQLKDLSVYKLQITLDGFAETHDQRRCLKNGVGTYNVIMSNLRYLLEVYPEVLIDIRSNIDKTNDTEYTEFFCFLRSNFGNDNIRPYAGFVSDIGETGCTNKNKTYCSSAERACFYIRNHKANATISSFLPTRQIHTCIANTKSGLVIGPEGEVYKCWIDIGEPKEAIGNIGHPDAFDLQRMAQYTCYADYIFDPKCRACIFMPVCNGGCPKSRILNKKNNTETDTCFMAKNFLKEYLEYHIKLKRTSNP